MSRRKRLLVSWFNTDLVVPACPIQIIQPRGPGVREKAQRSPTSHSEFNSTVERVGECYLIRLGRLVMWALAKKKRGARLAGG